MPAKIKPPTELPDINDLRGVLAYNIRLHRVRNGLSQEDLALACGLDRTYVSAVERSVWNIALSNVEKVATALGIEPWKLLRPPRKVVRNSSRG